MKPFTFTEKTSLSTSKNHNILQYLEIAEKFYNLNLKARNEHFENTNYGN